MAELQFGTDSHKLVRSDDPDTSHKAAHRVDTGKLERWVYDTIAEFGPAGCISDEVRAHFPQLPYSSVTARYKALMDKRFIVDSGKRRPGQSGRPQRVMVSSEWLSGEREQPQLLPLR